MSASTHAGPGGSSEYGGEDSMPGVSGRGSVGSSVASLLYVSAHACSVHLNQSTGSCSGGSHRASHPYVSGCAFSGLLDSETSTDKTGIGVGA